VVACGAEEEVRDALVVNRLVEADEANVAGQLVVDGRRCRAENLAGARFDDKVFDASVPKERVLRRVVRKLAATTRRDEPSVFFREPHFEIDNLLGNRSTTVERNNFHP
jgi:hypothetical protein